MDQDLVIDILKVESELLQLHHNKKTSATFLDDLPTRSTIRFLQIFEQHQGLLP